MKKISNVEVRLISLNANDVIATSGFNSVSRQTVLGGDENSFVGARGYYDDEEEW